ncbi:MAG: hypothetical protein EDX89_22970 [Acidobacteria bacterium]|nr:MAG: hypothetical protein EDX89_22970 [Acidobacteriota bacterium]MCE7884035.1 hypothetical protein [Actinobacteria bacterium ATB1]
MKRPTPTATPMMVVLSAEARELLKALARERHISTDHVLEHEIRRAADELGLRIEVERGEACGG